MIELVFILDKSGSMEGLEKDTIGGFNSMIQRQKKEAGEAYVSTILFNEESKVIHDRVSIKDLPKLTEEEYYVEGCTALLDAVGGAIKHIGNIHKYARKEDVPDKTLFVITTDGMENASRRYSYREVKRLITNQREKYGWEFIFLGANIDAEGEGEKFGIKREMAVNYHSDEKGTELNYRVIGDAISYVRRNKGRVDKHWKDEITEDYENRKDKNN